jgi:hypothetical protein
LLFDALNACAEASGPGGALSEPGSRMSEAEGALALAAWSAFARGNDPDDAMAAYSAAVEWWLQQRAMT